VAEGSALDREARLRGNSTYLPNQVIPMLPEALSNGLCSLNPQVDRLCMACEMSLTANGAFRKARFFEGVMRSHARLTYNEVAAMLEGGVEPDHPHVDLLPRLQELHRLFQVLRDARRDKGAIDFDTTESRFLFDEQGHVTCVEPLSRNDAHRVIEECMLMANVAAARLLARNRMPVPFRIHEGPSREKLEDLRAFLGGLGLRLEGGDKPTARDYAMLLEQVADRPDRGLIQTLMLRSMSQAVYSAENTGHFGLAFAEYCHFTSPIRRYPDLLVHRAIKHLLNGGKASDFSYGLSDAQQISETCSNTERRSDEVSRDVANWLKCDFMQQHVGGSFHGVISGVNGFGLFVQLDGLYIDGLLHITALNNDYYHFDPVAHKLVGERTGRVYQLGDPVEVTLAAVDLDERKIDFVLPKSAQTNSHARSRSRSKASRRKKAKS
jgi:ribonuclease R